MTDKQIIIDGVDVLKEKINMCFILLLNKLETSETIEQTIYEHLDVFVEEWNKQLKRKEQECKELKKIINEAKNSKLDLNSFFAIEATVGEYQLELDQLKEQIKYQNNFIESLLKATNNSEWLDKSILDDEASEIIKKIELDYVQLDEFKQTLTEIKPILELYANSKIGEEQPDGTYKIMLSGGCVMVYDPRPAREGLKKISEVLE